MSLTLSIDESNPKTANVETGELVKALKKEGVKDVVRERSSSDSLDAGTLLTIAVPIAVTLAHGIAAYLKSRFHVKVKVKSKKGEIEIDAVESKDIAKIVEKLNGIM